MSLLFPERRRVLFSRGMDLGSLKGRIAVTLPNSLVRYLVVQWSGALEGEAEEQAYLRHHFGRVHGDRAKGWAFRWSGGLASAIDKDVLEALKARKNVVSIQPALMAAFNAVRRRIPAAGAWLVLAEEGRACVALFARGRWLAVQNARGSWQDLLERERLRCGEGVLEVLHVQ